MNKQKTVLITGIAGLLGSRLADWIIENKPEYKVVGIDDLSGGFEENINPKVDLYQEKESFYHKNWILPFESDIKIKGL